jgi:hypothetical protein
MGSEEGPPPSNPCIEEVDDSDPGPSCDICPHHPDAHLGPTRFGCTTQQRTSTSLVYCPDVPGNGRQIVDPSQQGVQSVSRASRSSQEPYVRTPKWALPWAEHWTFEGAFPSWHVSSTGMTPASSHQDQAPAPLWRISPRRAQAWWHPRTMCCPPQKNLAGRNTGHEPVSLGHPQRMVMLLRPKSSKFTGSSLPH